MISGILAIKFFILVGLLLSVCMCINKHHFTQKCQSFLGTCHIRLRFPNSRLQVSTKSSKLILMYEANRLRDYYSST